MSNRKIPTGRWLLMAGVSLLTHFGGAGYMAVILATIAILPLNYLFRDGFSVIGKGMALAEWLWTMIVLSYMLPGAGASWPGEYAEVVVPLVLLLASSANRNGVNAGWSNGTLFWLMLPMLFVVAVAGISNIRLQWMEPTNGDWQAGLIIALLLPTVMGAVEPIRRKKTIRLLQYGLLAVVGAAILQGTLGAGVAGRVRAPMFEMGRSIGNGGLEMMSAAVLTFGWYAFCSLMIASGAQFGKRCGILEQRAGKWTAAIAAIFLLSDLKLPDSIMVGGSLLLWILVPILHPKNNLKKDEKSS